MRLQDKRSTTPQHWIEDIKLEYDALTKARDQIAVRNMNTTSPKSKLTFKPTLWPTLATIALLPVLISLGLWQWHRADYKQRLHEHYFSTQGSTPLTLDQALKDPEGFRYFPMSLHGHYLPEKQFLQDNQFYEHQVGFYVLTPFITDSHDIVLVNRGWITKQPPQTKLDLSTQPVTITGRVSAPPSRTFFLGNNFTSSSPKWPKVMQAIKMRDLSEAFGQPLQPIILLLNPDQPDGFARNWQPQGLPPEKHRAYSLQWFAFASLLVVLFVVLNIRHRNPYERRKTQ